jgi:hypothetical protein
MKTFVNYIVAFLNMKFRPTQNFCFNFQVYRFHNFHKFHNIIQARIQEFLRGGGGGWGFRPCQKYSTLHYPHLEGKKLSNSYFREGGGGKKRPMLGAQELWQRGSFIICHTCCDTGPRCFRSPKECPVQSPLTTHIYRDVIMLRMRPRPCVKAGVA